MAVAWGVQFVIVDEALHEFPPLMFAAIRFTLVAFPAVLFIARPRVSWTKIIAVGLMISAAQFGFQYLALAWGMPPGLLSLVLQSQVAFTMLIGIIALRERPHRQHVTGLLLAGVGVAIIATGFVSQRGAPIIPLLLVLAAALAWGAGNVITRSCGSEAGFSLIIWSSLAAPAPLLALSLLTEHPGVIAQAITHPKAIVVVALLYTVIVASLFGYGSWSKLLAKHESYRVAPFSLLVPLVGMLTAWIVQSEIPTPIEVTGGVLMLAGALLCILRFTKKTTAATMPVQ